MFLLTSKYDIKVHRTGDVVYSSPDKQTVHVVLGGDDVSTRARITILLCIGVLQYLYLRVNRVYTCKRALERSPAVFA